MVFLPKYPPGATPLDPDEAEGLIPSYISTQAELNEAEQANNRDARTYYFSRLRTFKINEKLIREVHSRMFGKVWRWAGKYRSSGKNIGAAKEQIVGQVAQLCDDTNYWIQNHTFPWDGIGVRFHHRLVLIHPFANGNGRHSRLVTDLLLAAVDQIPFSWGAKTYGVNLDASQTGALREEYLRALRAADAGDLTLLSSFAKS